VVPQEEIKKMEIKLAKLKGKKKKTKKHTTTKSEKYSSIKRISKVRDIKMKVKGLNLEREREVLHKCSGKGKKKSKVNILHIFTGCKAR
jgi:hypothetical protein